MFVNVAPARRWLGDVFTDILHDKLQTEVRIGEVEIGLFNRITLRDVLIKDREGRPLLDGGILSAKVALAPLLKGKVALRSVSLLDVSVLLCKASPEAPANFQFIIDAFSPPKPTDAGEMPDLQVNSLILRRCRVRYDESYRPQTKGTFNPSHLDFQGISANLSLRCLTSDSLSLRVRSLKFREQCGWNVDDLMLRLTANRRSCRIANFELLMPESHIRQDSLAATYDVSTDLNAFLHTLNVSGVVGDAVISTKDIAVFVPAIRPLNYKLSVAAAFSLSPKEWNLRRIVIDDRGGKFGLRGKVSLRKRGGRWDYVDGNLAEMHFQAADFVRIYTETTRKTLPDFVSQLGQIRLHGSFNRAKETDHIEGDVGSEAGDLHIMLSRKSDTYSLQTRSAEFSVARLLQNDVLPHSLAFEANTVARIPETGAKDVQTTLNVGQADFHGYTYQNLQVEARWDGKTLTSAFVSQDENLAVEGNASAMFDGSRFEMPRLAARLRTFAPQRLNLYDKWGDVRLSATVSADFAQLTSSGPEGTFEVRDFVMTDDRLAEDYRLKALRMDFKPSQHGTHFRLFSDFAQADIDGKFSFAALKDCTRELFLKNIHPDSSEQTERQMPAADRWRFSVQVFRDDFFRRILQLPLSLSGTFVAEGTLSAGHRPSSVVAHVPGISYGSFGLRDFRFYLNDTGSALSCLVQGVRQVGLSDIRFAFETETLDGRLLSSLQWDDGSAHRYYGSLKTVARFAPDFSGDSVATFDILPTDIAVGDTVWNVTPGRLEWRKTGFDVSTFRLEHADQSLSLSGCLSAKISDGIVAELNRLEVGYVLSLINLKPVAFSGPASGTIRLGKDAADHLQVAARLQIPDFYFNESPMGTARIDGRWNAKDGRLWLDADMQSSDSAATQVQGYVGITEKGLDLNIDSRNTNLRFLRRYLSEILGPVDGTTTGRCRIFGSFKALDFEGEERPSLATTLPATGVSYRMDDGLVRMSPGRFALSGFRLSDKDGGIGRIEGQMNHRHLSDINYNFDIEARNLLIYDQPQTPNASFFATVYSTGNIALQGTPGHITADINIRPDRRTLFTYIVDSPEDLDNSRLLRFTSREPNPDFAVADSLQTSHRLPAEPPTTDIILNFLIEATPQATLKVVTNEKAGDYILMNGHGAIRATYYNKAPLQMFGTYTIDRGEYKMNIQDIIRKDFSLQPEGNIVFAGNPLDASLNLEAVYSVPSASLADLNVGNNISDNSVKVNCILKIGGRAAAPSITLDLDLPTVGNDVKQMVRQLIATEEDMNMQVLYLLGVGRFYTYNFSDTQAALGGQSQSSLAMKSFLSNTLSSQLNNIISNAIGASNWTFGANLATGQTGWSDMEVAGLLTGRLLNNRLLINGNFGYRDRATASTGFVGDFDISYLLTPTGTVSLKAYSETNDKYFSKSSLTTQGIGIKLRRDFTNLRDLFTIRRRSDEPTAAETPRK